MVSRIGVSATLAGLFIYPLSHAAFAQAPGTVQVDPWSSWYAGLQTGYNGQFIDYRAATLMGSVTTSAPIFGVYGGRTINVAPQLYIGLGASVNYLPVDSTNIVGLSSPRTITNFDSDLQFTIGYRVMPNIMPYALAGVRFTDQEIKFPTISQSFLRTGWEVGGGVKSYLGEGFYGKVEVAHVDYGNKVYVGDLPVGLRALTVKVGIEKHFGKDAPAEYVRVAGAPGY